MSEPIYVALLGEGTHVWRPVAANQLAPRFYEILAPMPDDEQWQFPPGAIVRCDARTLPGGQRALVAIEIAASQERN